MRDLKRQLGFVGACVLGLGSIMGTGVYVSLGLGAGLVGPGVLAALFVGLLIAVVNGMNSAQLAAVWPRSGGTYEYGYHFLSPVWGFSAGVLFLVAKSASAATAALGFAGYLHGVLDWTGFGPTWTAGVFVLVLGSIALVGLKPAFRVTALLVGISLVCLLVFVGAGLVHLDPAKLQPFFRSAGRPLTMFETVRNLGEASALMFVAYTGYGRIATLGEEVTEPRRTIPRAVLVTLALSFLIYALTALVALMVGGAEYLAGSTAKSFAPLQVLPG